MKNKNSFLLMTKIVGMIITAWILLLMTIELIGDLKEGIEGLFQNFITDHAKPYLDPNVLILIYLVGYLIVWWNKIWGSAIIIIASILGIIFSEAGDIQFHFMLTFLVGILYFMNWNYERRGKKKHNNA